MLGINIVTSVFSLADRTLEKAFALYIVGRQEPSHCVCVKSVKMNYFQLNIHTIYDPQFKTMYFRPQGE